MVTRDPERRTIHSSVILLRFTCNRVMSERQGAAVLRAVNNENIWILENLPQLIF